jgi:hypothetical protein
MMTDHFHELSGLLFGARDRYRTVRATIRHLRRGNLATEAENRYVEYGFRHGILSNFDPPFHEPRYLKYEDLEEMTRLWHERPDRWRQETTLSDGSSTTYRVADGKGPWWFYQPPDWADYSPTNSGEFSPDGELSGLLDPSELFHSLDDCRLRIVGRGVEALGRETIEVEAKAISWDYAPIGPFWNGADDYLILVDAEIGVILRLASRFRGEECDSFEVLDIGFDETFPQGTFALELPGVRFEEIDRS